MVIYIVAIGLALHGLAGQGLRPRWTTYVAIPTFREELDCEELEVGPPITICDCEPAEHRESAGGGVCG
jgi:hypothetical protein